MEKPTSVSDNEKLQKVYEFVESLEFSEKVKWERTNKGQSIHIPIDWEELDEWE